jgi:hypothetical protein
VRTRRTENEPVGISFLDVITCGFGAIILLLMIAKTGGPPIPEASPIQLEGRVRDLQTQLFEVRGDGKVLNRDLNAKHEQLSIWDDKVARLQTNLAYTKSRVANLEAEASVGAIVEGRLELALQKLTDEMKRLLGERGGAKNSLVGGIPIDSEYIIFIIDTSGSMQNFHWGRMVSQVDAILNIYPRVKGIQIMSDMGQYMFSQYRRKWMPDTKGRRRAIISAMRGWSAFSNSSPVEGIEQAIKHFYDPKKRISMYVLGDEFSTGRIRDVVETVRRINPKGKHESPPIRIHAIGFPAPKGAAPFYVNTNSLFAKLMRQLTLENGGTFVGLL